MEGKATPAGGMGLESFAEVELTRPPSGLLALASERGKPSSHEM